jgi:hypothetical protein
MTFPKLNKSELQKLGLSVMGFILLLYVYFTYFLGPLNKTRNVTLNAIADCQKKIDGSKTELAKASNVDRQAKDATARFAALKALRPEGAPIAWFPPRIKMFFANQQIEKAVARLESNTDFKQGDLSGWTKYNWVIELPQTDFALIGKGIAELENSEPLLSITKLSIHTVHEQPQFQQVAIAASTIIEKR